MSPSPPREPISCEATVTEVLPVYSARISADHPERSTHEAKWLLEALIIKHGLTSPLGLWSDLPFTLVDEFKKMVQRRVDGEPLQYLLGEQTFFDMELSVGPGVFIARLDTEDLLREFLPLLSSFSSCGQILDLCAGSGAMGLAVARERRAASLTSVEKSPEALPYLTKNLQRWLPRDMVSMLVPTDMFSFVTGNVAQGYDIVLCNPPYIDPSERSSLPVDVLKEPSEALFAPDKGESYYQKLGEAFVGCLRPGGWLLMEHHADDQPRRLQEAKLWSGTVERVVPLKDRGGRPRGVAVKKGV